MVFVRRRENLCRFHALRASSIPSLPKTCRARPLDQPPYLVTFASSPEVFDAVLRLRFDVFNLELREGFAESYQTGRDEDAFNRVMRHLIGDQDARARSGGHLSHADGSDGGRESRVLHRDGVRPSGRPRGAEGAGDGIGRACISRPHRNRLVLYMLWKGLRAYMLHNQQRYLFGCCSLTTQDPAEGWRAFDHLAAEDHLHPEYQIEGASGLRMRSACRPSDRRNRRA